jgi:hypothetical protein
MVRARLAVALTLLGVLVAATGCQSAEGRPIAAKEPTTSTTVASPTTTARVLAAPVPRSGPVMPAAMLRTVAEGAWTPFASTGEVVLHHPANVVERVGFHESNDDGAQQLEVLPGAADPVTLESRERGTGSRTAADVVVQPTVEIRAPVTGTVIRAGSYVLYCDYNDNYVVIEPDAHPGWEVKVLHIDGLLVATGDRVTAGVTAIAPHARQLPFASQVDELTTTGPAWPHVHVEVVDPTVPDRPGEPCP